MKIMKQTEKAMCFQIKTVGRYTEVKNADKG